MNTEGFLKEHPSLKEIADNRKITIGKCDSFGLDIVHETQIDKKILKDAIEKCTMKDGVHGDTTDTLYPDQLKEILGLK